MTFRSEKLRRLVSSLACQKCGREGMTQCAHGNVGKGMGMKTSDATCFAACVDCHTDIDIGGMPKEERRALEAELNLKTLRLLVENGDLLPR